MSVRKLSTNQCHAEIMRILESRRQEKMSNLALQFNVTRRTICSDIEVLTVSYPLETVQGRYGCVKLKDGYAMYQSFLSKE